MELLEQAMKRIVDLEGCPYVPASRQHTEILPAGTLRERNVRFTIPKSQAMQEEINALRGQATAMKGRHWPDSGRASGRTLEEIKEQAHSFEEIPPPDAIIADYLAALDKAGAEDWQRKHFGMFQATGRLPERQPHYEIAWKHGELDLAGCRVVNQPPRPDQGELRRSAAERQAARAAAAQIQPALEPTAAARQARADAVGRQAWPPPAELGIGVQDFEN